EGEGKREKGERRDRVHPCATGVSSRWPSLYFRIPAAHAVPRRINSAVPGTLSAFTSCPMVVLNTRARLYCSSNAIGKSAKWTFDVATAMGVMVRLPIFVSQNSSSFVSKSFISRVIGGLGFK